MYYRAPDIYLVSVNGCQKVEVNRIGNTSMDNKDFVVNYGCYW